jgi:hypothetical protein
VVLLLLLLCRVQVPDSIKEDPQELQHLLDESKHLARNLDGEQCFHAYAVYTVLL